MRHLGHWAQRVMQDVPEGVLLSALSRRQRLAWIILHPRQMMLRDLARWRAATAMPGDLWYCPRTDVLGRVEKCLPDGVVLEVASAQFADATGWPHATYPPGVRRAFLRVTGTDREQWDTRYVPALYSRG
jgi:hypothetical protein